VNSPEVRETTSKMAVDLALCPRHGYENCKYKEGSAT